MVIFHDCDRRKSLSAENRIPVQPESAQRCCLASASSSHCRGQSKVVERTRCSTLEQMKLVNLFIRAVETGSSVTSAVA